jgi:MFS family permease
VPRGAHTIVPATSESEPRPDPRERFHPVGLSILFGLLYFIQGSSEPTDGLIAQPINSLLKSWGHDAAEIAGFTALLWVPWTIKPIYGLISDFLPLAGYHRKSYLIACSAVTAVCFLIVAAAVSAGGLDTIDASTWPLGRAATLLVLLVPATIGVAFTDVVVDALMVTKGQPHGLTGRFQAVQWGALYGATILTGSLGGYFSQHARQSAAFLICGGLTVLTLVLCATVISEPRAGGPGRDFRGTLQLLRHAAASRTILAVGAFMFCWNFNPFSSTVLYMYTTTRLGFSEQFYGNMMSLQSLAAMIGSLLYGFYCRRVPMSILIHVSIVLGIVATAGYWALVDEPSARAIAVAAGFATATATVIQLDLAAQVCPPQTAGTLFALLMGLSNLGTALSMSLGGWWYERWQHTWGNPLAFNLLVGIGALFTAGCWLVMPFLKRALAARNSPRPEAG